MIVGGQYFSMSYFSDSDFIISVADCYDVLKAKLPLPGIYTLHPDSYHSFNAHCLDDGWTVIQSRGQFGNPKDYFLRKWDAYVKGFGEPGNGLFI